MLSVLLFAGSRDIRNLHQQILYLSVTGKRLLGLWSVFKGEGKNWFLTCRSLFLATFINNSWWGQRLWLDQALIMHSHHYNYHFRGDNPWEVSPLRKKPCQPLPRPFYFLVSEKIHSTEKQLISHISSFQSKNCRPWPYIFSQVKVKVFVIRKLCCVVFWLVLCATKAKKLKKLNHGRRKEVQLLRRRHQDRRSHSGVRTTNGDAVDEFSISRNIHHIPFNNVYSPIRHPVCRQLQGQLRKQWCVRPWPKPRP